MNELLNLSVSRLVSLLVVVSCFLLLVNAALPQLELYLGQSLAGNIMIKGALLAAAVLGYLVYPRSRLAGLPIIAWLLCIGYLIADITHLVFAHGMSLGDVLLSYNAYYLTLLIGPALLAFHGTVPERVIIRCTVLIFLICAAIGVTQYLTAQPILYTESPDGTFRIESWSFFDEVRAFSLFTSAMEFGMFCALCGALGISLSRRLPIRGALLFTVSAIACFTTLTRLSYLVFICACTSALVLTFGKRSARGLWHPLLYFALGVSTILVGLNSLVSSDASNLQDASSLLERIGQWTYYYDVIVHSTLTDQLFGVGIVQNNKILPLYPMVIDDLPLALILHIGIVGLVLFGILMSQMWLYLRREALATRQPFLIAAASLWATLACAGIFNIVFNSIGIVFALGILCAKDQPVNELHKVEEKQP
jgi:hypothetical protein